MNRDRSTPLMVLRPVFLAAVGAAHWCGSAGADDAPGRLALNAQRVAVFKDGYALIVKKAKGVADAAGTVHTLEVPESAVLGTFWVLADGGGPVIARAEYVPDEVKAGPCLSVLDLVRANVGRHVTLDGNRRLTGTIAAVLEPDPASAAWAGRTRLKESITPSRPTALHSPRSTGARWAPTRFGSHRRCSSRRTR